jgi:hypothetical protein
VDSASCGPDGAEARSGGGGQLVPSRLTDDPGRSLVGVLSSREGIPNLRPVAVGRLSLVPQALGGVLNAGLSADEAVIVGHRIKASGQVAQ